MAYGPVTCSLTIIRATFSLQLLKHIIEFYHILSGICRN